MKIKKITHAEALKDGAGYTDIPINFGENILQYEINNVISEIVGTPTLRYARSGDLKISQVIATMAKTPRPRFPIPERWFMKKEQTQKIKITLLIDLSGSTVNVGVIRVGRFQFENLNQLYRFLAKIFWSVIKQYDDIELEIMGFGANTRNGETVIFTVDNITDIENLIPLHSAIYGRHGEAVQYALQKDKDLEDYKRLIVILTDGYPETGGTISTQRLMLEFVNSLSLILDNDVEFFIFVTSNSQNIIRQLNEVSRERIYAASTRDLDTFQARFIELFLDFISKMNER